MILFFSGQGCDKTNPEVTLCPKATLMLTFADQLKGPDKRFKAVLKSRKKDKKK